MNNRFARRFALSVVVAAISLTGLAATAAHADTLPGNTPSLPFPAAAYGRGCAGPGPNVMFDSSPPLVDPSPWAAPWVFFVNFRPACDMRDAGYAGGIVFDSINGGVVDTRAQSRLTVDFRFLGDLMTSCNRQIGANAPVARSLCYPIATAYFSTMRASGGWWFDASPAVTGLQLTGARLNN